jgi:hypothetical protein
MAIAFEGALSVDNVWAKGGGGAGGSGGAGGDCGSGSGGGAGGSGGTGGGGGGLGVVVGPGAVTVRPEVAEGPAERAAPAAAVGPALTALLEQAGCPRTHGSMLGVPCA